MELRAKEESAKGRRGWFAPLAVALIAIVGLLVSLAAVGGAAFVFARLAESDIPRRLPNKHRLVTVNGTWHSIADPGGIDVNLHSALPGADIPVVYQLQVAGDIVFGTVHDVGIHPIAGEGFFIYNTKTKRVSTYAPDSEDQFWIEIARLNIEGGVHLMNPHQLPPIDAKNAREKPD